MAIVLGVVGAAVGGYFGGPSGAAAGWSLGYAIGNAVDPPGAKRVSQPLQDLRIPGAEYGQPIPWLRGAMAMPGQYWWNTDKIPVTTTTTTGGKGGEPEVESENTTYVMDVLIGFTDLPIVGIGRIWDSGKLIRSGGAATSIDSEHWERLTVYTGAADQLPDPDYEAAVGVGNAPAYRGRGSCFIKGLKLGQSGQLRQLMFEVIVDGAFGGTLIETFGSGAAVPGAPAAFDGAGTIWLQGEDTTVGPDTRGSLAVFDMLTRTWLTPVELPDDLISPYSNALRVLAMVPAWDKAYVHTRYPVPSAPEFAFIRPSVFSISSRLFESNLGAAASVITEFGSELAVELFGIDVPNETMLLGSCTSNVSFGFVRLARFAVSDGLPVGVGVSTDPSARARDDTPTNMIGKADAAGDYWFVSITDRFVRTLAGGPGLTTASYSAGADGIAVSPAGLTPNAAFAYDPDRDCIYYFSADFSWLKKWDCATRTASRLNSVAYNISSPTDPTYLVDATIEYSADTETIYLLKGFGPGISANVRFHIVNPVTGASEALGTFDNSEHSEYQALAGNLVVADGTLYSYSGTDPGGTDIGGIGEISLGYIVDCPSVPDVQSAICERAGLSAGQIDVTPLASITRRVCCLPWTQITPARQPTELLMANFFYELVLSGNKIKFVPRGGAPVVTLDYDELGAGMNEASAEGLRLREINDLEMPAQIAASYINIANDYQQDVQISDRLISATSGTVETMQMAIGMTPSEMKGVVDTMLLDRAASVWSTKITLLGHHTAVEPTDVFLVTGPDGSVYRMRAVVKTDSFPLLGVEAVLDVASVLTSQGITSVDYESSTVVQSAVRTDLELIDGPILRDADNDHGFYAAARGFGSPWPGGNVYASADNVTYAHVVKVAESAVFGRCTTTLGNWVGPRMIDETNSVTVNVWPGTLSSSTRAAVLNDQGVNAILVGSEYLQFITATLISEGVYKLTRLLRGGRGSEWAMVGHAPYERCVLLRPQGLRRIVPENSELGLARYYKGVTLGRPLSSATAQLFTANAVGLKPFAPVDLRATRDDYNNITVTMQRRSRLSTRVIGALGINIPLGEAVADFELDVRADSSDGGAVVRTITDFTEVGDTLIAFEYSAIDQLSDGFTPGDFISFAAHQISAAVGRGYALEGVV